jgi:acyl-CoA reductase-like NAD-dependent aldehyde dehydrogenase
MRFWPHFIRAFFTHGSFSLVVSFLISGSESEAVRLANNTEYGLASAVYSTDLTKAHRVANLVRAGQVGINCYSLFHAGPDCPWVGHKGSGFGYHSGPDGWRQFSMPKSLVHEGAVPTDTALMKELKTTLVSKL